jgi:hypothetical protein
MRYGELVWKDQGDWDLSQTLIDRKGRLGKVVRKRGNVLYISVDGDMEFVDTDPLLMAGILRDWEPFAGSGRRRGTPLPERVTDAPE